MAGAAEAKALSNAAAQWLALHGSGCSLPRHSLTTFWFWSERGRRWEQRCGGKWSETVSDNFHGEENGKKTANLQVICAEP